MFFSILGRDAQVLAPFLAAPVFDLLARLPAEYFLDHSFHTEAISLSYPKYAHLAYEAKDAVRRGNAGSIWPIGPTKSRAIACGAPRDLMCVVDSRSRAY